MRFKKQLYTRAVNTKFTFIQFFTWYIIGNNRTKHMRVAEAPAIRPSHQRVVLMFSLVNLLLSVLTYSQKTIDSKHFLVLLGVKKYDIRYLVKFLQFTLPDKWVFTINYNYIRRYLPVLSQLPCS